MKLLRLIRAYKKAYLEWCNNIDDKDLFYEYENKTQDLLEHLNKKATRRGRK